MNAVDADLSLRGVKSFVQTVLVIDNELEFERPEQVARPLTKPSAGFARKPIVVATEIDPAVPEEDVSSLDAKAIMDAFLRESMICGMHKPSKGNDLVTEAITAARRSDAVIIDWRLDGTDTRAAKAIVAGILDGDQQERGRLRLIAIYTSEPDLASVTTELATHLNRGELERISETILASVDTRIVVLNKDGTPGGSDEVKVRELPARIITEFSKLAGGILSTFAVTAIAAVRRSTHHVLSVFSSSLDGSYVAHRSALRSPEDAQEFALDLLTGELRSVVSMSPDAMEVLKAPYASQWIARRANDAGKVSGGGIELPVDIAKSFPEMGYSAVYGSLAAQKYPGKTDAIARKKAIQEQNVGWLFHDTKEEADRSARRFARLASFKSEPFGRTRLPEGWAPTLSLGSLLVRLSDEGEPLPDGYLLCTQPRCDAVRLKGNRRYPFQTGREENGIPLHLIAMVKRRGEPIEVSLRIGKKPHETHMIEFAPTVDRRVQALVGPSGYFEFRDTQAGRYLWLGDLRDMTAQRTASAVAARLHEVGIDEFEWLRLQDKKAEDEGE